MDEHDQAQIDVPALDRTARRAAAERAAAALAMWSRPELDATTWWAELAPFLSPAAQAAYEGTDPANVPQVKVRAAVLEPTSTGWLAQVRITTDADPYTVTLSRQFDGTWLIERISKSQDQQ